MAMLEVPVDLVRNAKYPIICLLLLLAESVNGGF